MRAVAAARSRAFRKARARGSAALRTWSDECAGDGVGGVATRAARRELGERRAGGLAAYTRERGLLHFLIDRASGLLDRARRVRTPVCAVATSGITRVAPKRQVAGATRRFGARALAEPRH